MKKDNVRITSYKDASEIDWLKDIHTALVNKYYQDVTDPSYDELDIGSQIMSDDGIVVGNILDFTYSQRDGEEREYALIELVKHVNFSMLIRIGVPVENIVFDCHDWNYNKDLVIEGIY